MSGIGLVLIGLMGPILLGTGRLGTVVVILGDDSCRHCARLHQRAGRDPCRRRSELAKRVGANPVTTSYRFLERRGHVAGPILSRNSSCSGARAPTSVIWIGVGDAVLGLLFVAHKSDAPSRTTVFVGAAA